MIPPAVAALAFEAHRLGARVLARECDHGVDHVYVFNAPAAMAERLRDAGYRMSNYRADYWRWCSAIDDLPIL